MLNDALAMAIVATLVVVLATILCRLSWRDAS